MKPICIDCNKEFKPRAEKQKWCRTCILMRSSNKRYCACGVPFVSKRGQKWCHVDCTVKRLPNLLRNRLNGALKGNIKDGSAVRDLGCSLPAFRKYMESKFEPGMSWHNHGDWHIDHIIPLSSFDLTRRDQLKAACHYTNLQPLWAEENWKKRQQIRDKK